MIPRALSTALCRTSRRVVVVYPRVIHRGISVKSASSALALLRELPPGGLLAQPSQEALNSISSALEGQQRAGWAWESPWDARVLAECIVALVELGREALPGGVLVGAVGGGGGVEPPPALLFHPVRRCLRLLTQALSPRLPEVPTPLLLQAMCALGSAGVVYAPLLRSIAGWVVAVEGEVGGGGGGRKGAPSALVTPLHARTFLATCDPEGIWGRLAARPGVVAKEGGLTSVPTPTLASTLALFATSKVAPAQEFAPFYTLLLTELCSRGEAGTAGTAGGGKEEEEEEGGVMLSPPHSIEYFYGWHRDAVKDGVSTPNLPNWASLVPPVKKGTPLSGTTTTTTTATTTSSSTTTTTTAALISPALATALLELHPSPFSSSSLIKSPTSSEGAPVSLDLLSRTASSIFLPTLDGTLGGREAQRLLLRDIPTVLKCLDCYYPPTHSQQHCSGGGVGEMGGGKEGGGLIDTLLSRAVELIAMEEEGQEKGGRKGQICYNCFGIGHTQFYCPLPRSRGVWGEGSGGGAGGETTKASFFTKGVVGGGSSPLTGYTISSHTPPSSSPPVYNIKSSTPSSSSSSSSEDSSTLPLSNGAPSSGGGGGGDVGGSGTPYNPHILSLLDHMTSHVFDISTGRLQTPYAHQVAPKLRLLTYLAAPFVTATAHRGVPLRYLSGFLYAHLCAGGGDPPPQGPYTVFLRDLGEALRVPSAQGVFGGGGGGEFQRRLLLQALWVCAGDGVGGLSSSSGSEGGTRADAAFPAAVASRARYEGRVSKAALQEVGGGSEAAAASMHPSLSPPSSSSLTSVQMRKGLMRGLVKEALSLEPHQSQGDPLPFLSSLALIATVGDAHPTTPLLFERLLKAVNPTSLSLLSDHTFTLLVFSTAAAAIQAAVGTPQVPHHSGMLPLPSAPAPEALLSLLLKEGKGRSSLSPWALQCTIDTLKVLEFSSSGQGGRSNTPFPLELSTLPPSSSNTIPATPTDVITAAATAPRVLDTLLDAMECVVSASAAPPSTSGGGGGSGGMLLPTFSQFPSLGRVSWAHPSMRLAVVLEEGVGGGGGGGEGGGGVGHTPLPPSLSHPLSLWRQRMLALLGWSCTRGVSVEAFMGASSARARSTMVVKSAQTVQQY